MSTTTAARRIALLSTSSLGLAAIVSAASLGASLAPTAAAAQTVTCTAGVTPLSGPTVVIPAGTHNPGVTCAYVGDGATVSTAGNITVSSTAPANIPLNGVNLTATGTDDINWNSSAGNVTGGAQTNGPVIDAQTTGAGNINLTIASVTALQASITHGVYAVSAGGDITINGGGASGLSATLANPVQFTALHAETSGAGAVNINLTGIARGSGSDGAGIYVSNGTGDVTINTTNQILGGNCCTSGSLYTGSGLVVESGGDITLNSSSRIMGAVSPGVRPAAITASGQSFTLNLTGNLSVHEDDVWRYSATLGMHYSSASIPAQMGTSNVGSPTGGRVDFSGVTGGAELNFSSRARWMVSDTSLMSPGDDRVNIDATSVMMTTNSTQVIGSTLLPDDIDQTVIPPGVIDFGDGHDTLNNLGRILIGPVFVSVSGVGTERDGPPTFNHRFGMRGELRFIGLDSFVNAGEIWLGAKWFGAEDLATTDFWTDDLLYMPGAAFHGEAGSRIFMDINLNESQSSCAPETRDENGWLPAADCLGIQGGSATGRTELVLIELTPGDRGSFSPDGIVLIDLAGGNPDDTDPDAFFISPSVRGYTDAIGNGAIDKGLFFYTLGFDAETQQFKLFGQPGTVAQQLPMLATAANQLWHTATGGWFHRRVDQRDVMRDDGLGTGAWFNLTGTSSTRDITTTIPFGVSSADFDNSYDQSDLALSFGWDLISQNAQAGSWALGAMVGYARSDIEFEGDNAAKLAGVHVGAYGGYTWGPFFVDGAVNSAWLSLHSDVPGLNLTPTGTLLGTDVHSLGARVEAGWRWRSGPLSIEPLVGFSTVTTDFDEFRIPNDDPDVNRPGGVVTLDASDSRRASAGVRFALDELVTHVAPTNLSLTARQVKEFEGRSDVSIANSGPDALVSDTFDGSFTQLTGAVSVSNPSRTISGHLNLDAMRGDDYEGFGASVGVRLHW